MNANARDSKPDDGSLEENSAGQQWKTLPWKQLERQLFHLQKGIYHASRSGNLKSLRRLQRLLLKSRAAKTLAVAQVCADNSNGQFPAIDGLTSLGAAQRFTLVKELELLTGGQPLRRVEVSLPNCGEKILRRMPTMKDRALQYLVKFALEPEWEAKFHPNSYGFRPGRSYKDAIAAIYASIKAQPQYVLTVDLSPSLHQLDPQALAQKMAAVSPIRTLVKAWLKTGAIAWSAVDDPREFNPSASAFFPCQILAPLLLNIALDGLENHLIQLANPLFVPHQDTQTGLTVVRYAAQLVLLHPDKAVLLQCRAIAGEWLSTMGLSLRDENIRLAHTLDSHEGTPPGFDFRGFHIRQYPVGKYHSKLGFKTLIQPSKSAVKAHKKQIKAAIKAHQAASQSTLIACLNPLINHWCGYFCGVSSKKTFSSLDYDLHLKLKRWAKRRHPHKSNAWVKQKYWQAIGSKNSVFASHPHDRLALHAETAIVRHLKVRGDASPYDGDLSYWGPRLRESGPLSGQQLTPEEI